MVLLGIRVAKLDVVVDQGWCQQSHELVSTEPVASPYISSKTDYGKCNRLIVGLSIVIETKRSIP